MFLEYSPSGTIKRSSRLPSKEPNNILFESIAQYFAEQGVTKQEVKQR